MIRLVQRVLCLGSLTGILFLSACTITVEDAADGGTPEREQGDASNRSSGADGGNPPGAARCVDEFSCNIPPLDRGVTTNLFDATRFLYSGDHAVQHELDESVLDLVRVSVLRGKVFNKDGEPLSGVRVSVHRQDEFGYTLTRDDGQFDMVLNGNQTVAVSYTLDGYLPSQRTLRVETQEYEWLPDLVLVKLDETVTELVADADHYQVAQGSLESDSSGERTAVMLVPPQTTATAELPDGTTMDLDSLSIRATEYTVGENGPESMPSTLPAASGYTYAVELTIDEALDVGAKTVTFSQPIPYHVENFLAFPAGTPVPLGYYDRELARWVPSGSGVVIDLLDSGDAGIGPIAIDSDGDGQADPPEVLEALGVTEGELEQLADLYAPGQSLWRVMLPHFSTWDHNWPFSPPDDAIFPDFGLGSLFSPDSSCSSGGSIIFTETQVLGESIPIQGTGYTLNYFSDRGTSRLTDFSVEIPLTGDSPPDSLRAVELQVFVAGQRHELSFGPEPNQDYTFEWDGSDGYGRTVQGDTLATLRVGYVYDGSYTRTERFGSSGSTVITGDRTRQEVTLWEEEKVSLGSWDAAGVGLGGFSLNVHHAYHPLRQRLYLGNGRQRSAESVGQVATDIADPEFAMREPDSVAVAPDGRVYFSDDGLQQVMLIQPDGSVEVIAGTGEDTNNGDGGRAVEAAIASPQGLVVRPDGTLLVSATDRIRAISPDGIITTVVGGGSDSSAGVPADQARIRTPDQLAYGPEGNLYIAELDANRVSKLSPDGTVTTFAGGGSSTESNVPATEARLVDPSGLAIDSDGTVFISQRNEDRVVRVNPDGTLVVVIDNTMGLNGPRSIALDTDGSLLISDENNGRIVRWNGEELVTVVGGGRQAVAGGIAAKDAIIPDPDGIALGSDGSLFIAVDRVLRISPALPGLGVADSVLPSLDGNQMFIFDGNGRHLETRDPLTGATLLEFAYDTEGQLASVTSLGGQTTTFVRDGDRLEKAVAPYGQETHFSADNAGRIVAARDELDRLQGFAYTDNGLLVEYTDSGQGTHRFEYDSSGRLISDSGPTGFEQVLSRRRTDSGYEISLTTPMGRATKQGVVTGEDESRIRQGTDSASHVSTFTGTATSRLSQQPDGTQTAVTLVPDLRWQMQVPFTSSATITTPGGRQLSIEATQLAEEAGLSPLTPISYTESVTVDNDTVTRAFDAENNTLTVTDGEGRTGTTTFDEQGLVVLSEHSGMPSVQFEYDEDARLTLVRQISTQGDERVTRYTYDDGGFLSRVTDALGSEVVFANDPLGRPLSVLGPGQQTAEFSYTDLDLLATLTPDGHPPHEHEYDAAGLLLQYSPPQVDGEATPTQYSYNDDLQLSRTSLPDERSIRHEFDSAGRLSTLVVAKGKYSFEYEEATGRLAQFTTPDGNQLGWSHDGPVLLSTSWSGLVTGDISFEYDDHFRPATISITGGDSLGVQYDTGGALVSVGPVSIARVEGSGLVGGFSVGRLTTDLEYSAFAELAGVSLALGETDLERSYERDRIGRITEVTETLNGTSSTTSYRYDDEGRLVSASVESDLETTERKYEYDANGNRISFEVDGKTISAEYDAQDRILSYGSLYFEHSANGDVVQVLDTDTDELSRYEYDELGQLVSVELPGGEVLEYAYDLVGRRIAKSRDGEVTDRFIYLDALRPLAKLDESGAVVQQYVYATGVNVPDAVLQDGDWFALIRDQVGSVQFVVNSDTGEVIQALAYDEFGNVLTDTNPGFQPFGFAGGLYDTDTGLVHFGRRDYDARVGRWTSKDPIRFDGGQANLLIYADNDPVNFIDPSGLIIESGWDALSVGVDLYSLYNSIQCGSAGDVALDSAMLAFDLVALAVPLLPALGAVKAGRAARGAGLLARSEAAGGHLIARHVGQTTQQLSARLAGNARLPAASTFSSVAQAEGAVGSALQANASQVSGWVAAGARGRLVVNAPFSGGSVLVRGATSPVSGAGVRVVLQGNGSGAYHVLTGFPVP